MTKDQVRDSVSRGCVQKESRELWLSQKLSKSSRKKVGSWGEGCAPSTIHSPPGWKGTTCSKKALFSAERGAYKSEGAWWARGRAFQAQISGAPRSSCHPSHTSSLHIPSLLC